ncbi:hypothetical protein [Nocardia blacklockiae]|uniref:hypothetical protein n=1 Tax=Nocardia blacklockiae TaxID=480036 RepID=UPI0018961DA5|nr:hypothetical protein [Nocardia blacklockiae]MBF6170219.1 hypothetical protein [Nocardia blacklockiae]
MRDPVGVAGKPLARTVVARASGARSAAVRNLVGIAGKPHARTRHTCPACPAGSFR